MRSALHSIREHPFGDVCQALLRYADRPDRLAVVLSDAPDVVPVLSDPALIASLRIVR